ncbi:hypothetical protein [Qipengyuania flava]|uniref:hypothetical protein n=1 Tax=Qipengyuania flava TaxID=192812 RepID=UPI00273E85A6|nr:hypothetical protein [Qipengyuania flava]
MSRHPKKTDAKQLERASRADELRRKTRSSTLAAAQTRREGMVPRPWGPWGDVER